MEFAKLPQHVAFIMDGNGRWATGRGLLRMEGHRRGVETVRKMVEEGIRLGIPHMTFYAFSTENWQRPQEEVSGLMGLLREYFRAKLDELVEKGIKVRFIGNRLPGGRLAQDILDLMGEVEDKTAHNNKITATFAVNYSGRDELLRAVAYFGEDVQAGEQFPWAVDEKTFKKYLDTAEMPDPDLVIRTSGEERISNFMLWQMAYSELIFHESAWPAYSVEDFHQCLSAYVERDRRFGRVKQKNSPQDIDDV
jgi:undecaprenyl diphosphate synthase